MHPSFISFNQEIKLLSSFKLSIHGCSPLIQLRFLGEEKWEAGEWGRGHIVWSMSTHTLHAGAVFPQKQPELSPSPACALASPSLSALTAEEGPCPSLTRISGTFFFFFFSFTGGEIPGRVVSGTQGFPGTLGTSVNFEHTKGETPARSSVPSSLSKPKQDGRPGVEVEAQ